MDSSINQSLEHICIDNTCHCDFRLNIHGCEETRAMILIYIIHITLSGINVILGSSILYNRLFVVGYSLFTRNFQKQGPFGGFFLKIRPLECLLTFVLLYCLLRIIIASMLIADIKINIIFQSWISEFCWQVAYIGCSLYLIGIVQLLIESNETLFKKWLPGTIKISILGYWIFFSPLVLNNLFSILAGVFAVQNQQYLADLSTRLLYLMWVKHCTLLVISVVYAGARLIKIMNNYLSTMELGTEKYNKVKFTIFRIKITAVLIVICMLGFAILLFFYFLLRIKILTNTTGNIVLCTLWNLFADIIIVVFNIILLFSPDGNSNNSNNIFSLQFMYSDNNHSHTENYEISQLHRHHANNNKNNNNNNSYCLTTSITMTETIGDFYNMDHDSQEDLVKHLQKINNQLST
ncbi:unnamed protein product [Cunninghamella blakesleeana]